MKPGCSGFLDMDIEGLLSLKRTNKRTLTIAPSLPDRLQPHLFYLTSGNGAGLTNQVFACFNLIYLSLLTSRIPILPPFHANHQILSSSQLPELSPSSYFNLPLFLASVPLSQGILEWPQIYPSLLSTDPDDQQRFHDSEEERAGWPTVICLGEFANTEGTLKFARVKTTWTNYPPLVKNPKERLMSFLHLVPYLLPNSPFAETLASSNEGGFRATMAPNNSFACIDETMAGSDGGEVGPMEEIGYGRGSWKAVGRFLRFRDELESEGRRIAGRIFGWEEGGGERPFITIHIRHGDFLSFQCNPDPTKPCWSIPQFQRSLTLLQADLVAAGREKVTDVLVMTDETNEEFLAEIEALGWKIPKDGKGGAGGEALKEELGGWYDTLLDTVLLSQGAHIIGTSGSTMSVLSLRRVLDWNNGFGRLVGADDAS
ncbi:hypothetical protein BDY24DRAFT_398276 [Mrakia frigida]|uniref:O-fucosyltransferase family protein n=1 Tax=Mrakia frigida TaxID=29902 RepID=UPI003FCC03A4